MLYNYHLKSEYVRLLLQKQSMYIEPAEYLELTDRLKILTKNYERQSTQKTNLHNKTIALAQKIKHLQSRISQLQKQKQDQKLQLKQHVTNKTNNIISHISTSKENQRVFVEEQISKLRNWSAIQTLKKLEDRIAENRTVTFEKQFYEKVKTLYIIKKKKVGCSHNELFEWVRDIAELKKTNQQDNSIQATQKSMKSIKQSQRNKNPQNPNPKPALPQLTKLPPTDPEPNQNKPKQQPLPNTQYKKQKINEVLDEDDILADP